MVIAGLEKANVADTICDLDVNEPISATPIDPPTMSISITVNTSPLAGKRVKNLQVLKLEIDYFKKLRTT